MKINLVFVVKKDLGIHICDYGVDSKIVNFTKIKIINLSMDFLLIKNKNV